MKLLPLLAALVLPGCAATDYLTFQGSPVQQGHGGASRNVDGIDIWQEGTPPRKYQVIGVITDTRAAGPLAMAGRNKGIAKTAKLHGGDAVLLSADERQYAGTVSFGNASTNFNANAYSYGGATNAYGTANTFGTGVGVPTYRANSKYYVIKYL